MTKMKKIKSLYRLLIICVYAFSILMCGIAQAVNKDDPKLQYPGNGFPHLSRNKEITRLIYEIADYATSFKNAKSNGGRLSFENVDGFAFSSSVGITGDEYRLKVDLHILKGTCIIRIGNIKYIIRNKGITVYDGTKLIYGNDVDSIRTIRVMAYSQGSTSTAIVSNKELLAVEKVNKIVPAYIQISLSDGCSGYIGPWMWIRGME